MELYGGGPEVKLSGKDLSSYLSPEHKVEVILYKDNNFSPQIIDTNGPKWYRDSKWAERVTCKRQKIKWKNSDGRSLNNLFYHSLFLFI